MFYVFFIRVLHNNPQQNGEQVFVAANGSGYVIEFLILQYPRVTRLTHFNFFRSDRFCVVACTRILDQMLLAANGSGYVIEYMIWQHPISTRIWKYFFNFCILCGFCVVTRTKIGGQVLLAANGSSYVAEFIILRCFSIIRIQICFWNFSIFYGFCVATCRNLLPRWAEAKMEKKQTCPKNRKVREICWNAAKNIWALSITQRSR